MSLSTLQHPGKLIICPTPLGNLQDITKRSIEALSNCDVVCCEDTRVTAKLLAALGIEKRLERLDEAQLKAKTPYILNRIEQGQVVAYCTDAGMPGVSDPGLYLVNCAYERRVPVEVLPGPSALITAYVASGFCTQSFYFGAFFPRKNSERRTLLEALKNLTAALIFYESPKRLVSALSDIAAIMPQRRIAVCRELTKVHEEVLRGSADELYALFSERQQRASLKGEIVIVIDALSAKEQTIQEQEAKKHAADVAERLLCENKLSKREIISYLKDTCQISRNDAYELVHQKGEQHDSE